MRSRGAKARVRERLALLLPHLQASSSFVLWHPRVSSSLLMPCPQLSVASMLVRRYREEGDPSGLRHLFLALCQSICAHQSGEPELFSAPKLRRRRERKPVYSVSMLEFKLSTQVKRARTFGVNPRGGSTSEVARFCSAKHVYLEEHGAS